MFFIFIILFLSFLIIFISVLKLLCMFFTFYTKTSYILIMHACYVISVVSGFLQPMDCSLPDPLSMGISRQEYWSGLPCPSPKDLPRPGIEDAFLMFPALAGKFFITSSTWEVHTLIIAISYSLADNFRRRQWHSTPVLLPGKSHGRRSLVGCSPWRRWESDMTE